MPDMISVPCTAPEPGIVLEFATPPDEFFDAVFDDLITVGGEIQPETVTLSRPMLPDTPDNLELFLSVPLELCTACTRRPWEYDWLTLRVTGGTAA